MPLIEIVQKLRFIRWSQSGHGLHFYDHVAETDEVHVMRTL